MAGQAFSTLADMFVKSVEAHGPRRSLGTKKGSVWTWVSYAELGRRVDAVRGGLASLGIGRGDAVAIISSNRVEWAITAYATYGLGARIVPMYEAQLESDWEHIVADSGAKVLVVSTRAVDDKVRGWAGTKGRLEHVRCIELPADDERSFAGLESGGEKSPAPVVRIDPDELCAIVYTSGTTGKPKGVMLAHGNIVSNINAVHQLYPVGRTDCSVSFLPWAHSLGQTAELHCLLSLGAAIAIAESPDKLVQNFGEVRPTVMIAVPRIFNRIYDALNKKMRDEGGIKKLMFDAALANEGRRRRLASQGKSSLVSERLHKVFDRLVFSKVRDRFGGRLQYAFSGGAALSPEVAEFIDRMGITVYEGYGLTETGPIVSANRPGACKIGSVGKPFPGVTVTIDTSRVDDGSGEGELVVYGPNVMKGYHNLPDETAAVTTEDGGFRTGDRGRIDKDGFCYITGRLKEQYKLESGRYVAPAPVEERLQLSPYISQVFLHGENKPFNVALIVPDMASLSAWAAAQGLVSDPETLRGTPGVRDLIRSEIDRLGEGLRGFERVKDFLLIDEEFTTDNGMLTPTLKIKRRVVWQRYGSAIERIYEAARASGD